MRLLPSLVVTLALVAGCRETASCPEGQHYDVMQRGCAPGAPMDSGIDARIDGALDSGQDAGPCGGECPPDHCDVASGECLDCIASTECPTETPICGAGGNCIPCGNDEECVADHPASPNCTSGGTCERCDVASEAAVCGATSTCDLPSGACTTIPPHTRRICESCGSDLQCQGSLACVPMQFGAAAHGAYCLPRSGSAECIRPYLSLLTDRISLSSTTTADYCGPNEALTTCEAVLALIASRECAGGDVDLCMAEGALCNSVGAAPNQCTYGCAVANDCPSGLACAGTPARCGGS